MNGHGLRKTSSPKLVVPQVSEHESGLGVEHLQPLLQRVVDRAARRELDDQGGLLAQRLRRCRGAGPGRGSGGGRRRGCARGPSRRPSASQALAVCDQLVERGGQLRAVGLGGLGAGRRDGDQRAGGGGTGDARGGDAGRTGSAVGHRPILPAAPPEPSRARGVPIFGRRTGRKTGIRRAKQQRASTTRGSGATTTSWAAAMPSASRVASTGVFRFTSASAIGPSS